MLRYAVVVLWLVLSKRCGFDGFLQDSLLILAVGGRFVYECIV